MNLEALGENWIEVFYMIFYQKNKYDLNSIILFYMQNYY